MDTEHIFGKPRCFPLIAARGVVLSCALLFLLLTGCAFQPFARLNSNLQAMNQNSYISGSILHQSRGTKAFVAVYKESPDGIVTIASTCVKAGGIFTFIVPRGGEYCLAAFEDRNGNSVYDHGESSVTVCGEDSIVIDSETRIVRFDLSLDPTRELPDPLAVEMARLDFTDKGCVHVAFGEVTDLDNPIFSPENGKKGLWAPFDFLAETGIGVYFLEPFDPLKIPVLFINGAGGCPQDWRYFIENLDRDHFQPWVFYYPSGERLAPLAKVLHDIVTHLHERYCFSSMYVTAHSMGGLIGRDFILRQAEEGGGFVKLFVSFSTPWSGLESAKLGVAFAPATVPCWYDIQAGSPYLAELFGQSLSPEIATVLMFGYRGDRNPLSENNDGIVTLKSQLRWEAQREAVRVYGFNQDHDTILVNRDVFDAYSLILTGMQAPRATARK